jgi:hypothetical protein
VAAIAGESPLAGHQETSGSIAEFVTEQVDILAVLAAVDHHRVAQGLLREGGGCGGEQQGGCEERQLATEVGAARGGGSDGMIHGNSGLTGMIRRR